MIADLNFCDMGCTVSRHVATKILFLDALSYQMGLFYRIFTSLCLREQ